MPNGIAGVTSARCRPAISFAARIEISYAERQSTCVGKCGPCCSVAPSGMMITVLSCAAARIAGAVMRSQRTSGALVMLASSFAQPAEQHVEPDREHEQHD